MIFTPFERASNFTLEIVRKLSLKKNVLKENLVSIRAGIIVFKYKIINLNAHLNSASFEYYIASVS